MNKIFLACYDDGVTRAERAAGGEWVVTRHAAEHKVTCLAADPALPRRVYAGTRDGVLRSEDGGRTWYPAGMQGQIVKSLAVSPHPSTGSRQAPTLYAGAKPALIFKSTDGGNSWRELEGFRRIPNRWWWFSPAEPPDRRPYVFGIAPSPTEPDVLLAGVEFGAVVRSQDGGETWSRHIRGALRDCHSLKFHPANGDWAYEAGGSGGGASFSRDGGRTFLKAGRGLKKHYGIVCAADPAKPEVWYVCVGKSPFNAFGDHPEIYLYRFNGGAGWQPIGWTPHPLRDTPTTLVSDPQAPCHLYAGTKKGNVWHTADYGDTWEKLPFNLGGIWFSMLVFEDDGSSAEQNPKTKQVKGKGK